MNALNLLIKPASGACQYACAYCFYRDEMEKRRAKELGLMKLETIENIIKKAFAVAQRQVTFAFQGGEPMLAGRVFFEQVVALQKRYARGKAYANNLQTNGGLLDEEWVRFLKKESFLVGLSMDGDAAAHDRYRKDKGGKGTWEKTHQAAELLKKYEVPFNVLCVVTKANVARGQEIYKELKPYRFLQFIPCLEALDGEEKAYSPSNAEYARFLNDTFELYRKDYLQGEYTSIRLFDNYVQMLMGMQPESCSMRGQCSVSFTIESDGSVYPCDFYCLDEWRLGSVNEQSFFELMNSKTAKDFVNTSVAMHPKCKTCQYFNLCRGGCRREREQSSFDSAGKLNRYCEAYKSFFEQNYERLKELKELTLKAWKTEKYE